jgi:T4 bacteriophage base plate protein
MPLPKIDQPIFDMTIPSIGKNITFRPFLVKEEKILLIAQQSGNDTEVIRAIKQILNNCILIDIDLDSLAIFDIEYMFLKLRSKSVNNIVKLSYRDVEDGEVYDFELDLDTIEVTMPDKINSKIEITENVGMTMKYPSASITDRMKDFDNEVDLMTFFIVNCIDTIYDEDNVYVASDFSEEEISEFLDGLNVKSFEKIREFFESIPRLYHKIEYKNSIDSDRSIELTSLKDFFMWG